jgi:hypothetical protein
VATGWPWVLNVQYMDNKGGPTVETRRRWTSTGRVIAVAVSLGGLALAAPGTALHVGASTTIAHLTFVPSPIGTSFNTATGHTVPVVVQATDSTNAPIPGAQFYLDFHQTVGGGTAFVGTTVLGARPTLWTSDTSGKVTVNYVTPTTMANSGVDYIHAQNGRTSATSAVKVSDPFCYTTITSMGFTPSPIGRKGHLAAHQTVPVTLTVFKSGAIAPAGTTAWVTFKQAAGGGSAMIGSTALTAKAQAFTTDGSGQIHILYTTPSTLPTTHVVDVVVAGDESSSSLACTTGRDVYAFA